MSIPYAYRARLDKPESDEPPKIVSTNKVSDPINTLAREVWKNQPNAFQMKTVFNPEQRIARAFQNFESWVKNNDEPEGATNAAQQLLRWLHCDQGAKLILRYEEFVELANRLNSAGYAIPEVPSKLEFDKVWHTCQNSLKGEESVLLLLASRIREKQ